LQLATSTRCIAPSRLFLVLRNYLATIYLYIHIYMYLFRKGTVALSAKKLSCNHKFIFVYREEMGAPSAKKLPCNNMLIYIGGIWLLLELRNYLAAIYLYLFMENNLSPRAKKRPCSHIFTYTRLLGRFAPIFYLNCEHVLLVYILNQRRKFCEF